MKPGAFFRPNKAGEAVLAAGKRLYRRAPDFGTWHVRYKDSAGAIRREACSAELEEAATRYAMELHIKSERRRKGLEPAEFDIIPCTKLHAMYLEAHAHLSSQAPMRSQVKIWFDAHFKSKPTSDVTPADCEALLVKARAAGQAESTVRQLHIRGRLIWKYGVNRLRCARENPWNAVPRPTVAAADVVVLSRVQVEALLEAAGPYRLLLILAVLTGGRRGEFGGLLWTDFRLDEGPHGTIHFRRSWERQTTKGAKVRVVPLHPALVPEIERARATATSALVFPSPLERKKGGMRSKSWKTANLLRRIAKRAGVVLPEGTTFHTLRKTFITHLLRDSGGDIATAQQLAGHSTPAVTATYYVGRDVDYQASRVNALQLVARTPVEHAVNTRQIPAVLAGQETQVNTNAYASELPRRSPRAFIFL
ncbi:site-specific integrase [Myxococcus sp. AS-1-15]|uniref:tyrosine-type recombinase/integrase n=1 Tax=Myxococcus sp. AS-1-15 TaxID=2874600 RepID=UPI001CBF0CC7|nr:site-specific integrase [Myxococcus sp. AS-1-15]MBZ4398663.1 site-specific integrase [Myxococcus sp. AS-1-15]